MDLSLSQTQQDIVTAVRDLCDASDHKSSVQAEFDEHGYARLCNAGFVDISSETGSTLDAVLMADAVAATGMCAPVTAKAVVAPAVTDKDVPPVIGLVADPGGSLVRFGAEAEAFLVLGTDQAMLVPAAEARITSRSVRWGYPAARVSVTGGTGLGPGSREALLRSWRLAIAAEAGGLMRTAVLQTSAYVTEREQFGRPIGSYQAVQHRLAESWVAAEATTWLARRAAYLGDAVSAAAAACYAAQHMRETFRSTHQVCGGMGITDEFGLTRFTGKLAYLHTELGGAVAHARALARARWFDEATPA